MGEGVGGEVWDCGGVGEGGVDWGVVCWFVGGGGVRSYGVGVVDGGCRLGALWVLRCL